MPLYDCKGSDALPLSSQLKLMAPSYYDQLAAYIRPGSRAEALNPKSRALPNSVRPQATR